MIRKTALIAGLMFVAGQGVARADDVTVQSLLNQGYTIVGTIISGGGAGIYLQKTTTLYLCDVAETPTSPTVATRYCKPVK